MSNCPQTPRTGDIFRREQAEIAEKVRQASTSFYWAMRLLPQQRREAIFAVYAFCRAVDDIADEGGTLEQKQQGLAQWREEIAAIYQRQPTTSTGHALMSAVGRYPLQEQDFYAVIDGMEMDAHGPVIAPILDVFDLYCDRVACAVGRLCVAIFGVPGEKGRIVAHHLGRALQITNILRDVAEDADEGRLYLPLELLNKHGIIDHTPGAVMGAPGYATLWRELAATAQEEYRLSQAAMDVCVRARMRPARIMKAVYHTNLTRMMALNDDQISDPLHNKRLVGRFEKLLLAARNGIW